MTAWALDIAGKPDLIGLYDRVFLILPLGISFYTFQIIGAMVDQSRLRWKIRLSDWFAYALFFPQLIAGRLCACVLSYLSLAKASQIQVS